MEYIINGVVKYNPLNGTLYVADSGMNMLTLTRVTSELLLLLIQNNGVALSRDFILSELWVNRGLNASSNNLNNYVSMLRKALAQCGCTDAITTIPKHGFIFEADVVSIDENAKSPVVQTAVPDVDQPSLALHELVIERPSVRNRFFSRKVIGVVIVFCLLTIVFLPKIYDYFKLQSIRTEFFTYEQCQFYLADDKTREIATSQIISNLKVVVPKIKLNCGHRANVYYFADNKVDASGHVVLTDLISYCPYNSKAPCDNYYLTRHKKEDDNEK
ncbi:Transcriptional regulatory protein, C terminal [Serratia fonticola]|uniref:Transcriptional regulatory protein, C terminal n=1 Tax=Serratia fonticola TaxID=47917 RepID=A0A448S2I5_SERFO|nr:Transcriptional regulatory protein, C terminal [Serratia fonticola]